MPLSTYSELQTSIDNWLNRSDLAATIPDFITLAESQIQRDVKHWRRENRATTSITDQYTALPDDFYSPVRLHIQGQTGALTPITPAEMQDKRDQALNEAGEPCYYSITAQEIELFPTQTSGTLEMYYTQKIPALSDSNTSNWLLSEAPDIYLFGALQMTAPFLDEDRDTQRLQTWASLYVSAVRGLNKSSERGKWGGQKLKRRVNG